MKNYRVQDGCWNCGHCKDEDVSIGDHMMYQRCCAKQKTSTESNHHPVDAAGTCDLYAKAEEMMLRKYIMMENETK